MAKISNLKVTDGKNKKLHVMLKEKGVKKKELAEDIGITPQTMAKISRGENTGVETALRMAKRLECSVEDLFELEKIT